MFDLKRTFSSQTLTRQLASGTVVEQEGTILCHVLEDGVEKIALVAAPQGGEKPLGFAKTADSIPGRTSAVEVITVPGAAATLQADLRNQNLVIGKVRPVVISTGLVLTVNTGWLNVPVAGEVVMDLATGRCKFNAAQAGEDIQFTYLYDLTLVQAKQKFGQRFVNNWGLHAEHGFCEVGSGHCELYTDQYDTTVDWTVAVPTLGNNGQIVAGGEAFNFAAVVNVPSVDLPYLGVRLHFG